jgi:hypothetical protein
MSATSLADLLWAAMEAEARANTQELDRETEWPSCTHIPGYSLLGWRFSCEECGEEPKAS